MASKADWQSRYERVANIARTMDNAAFSSPRWSHAADVASYCFDKMMAERVPGWVGLVNERPTFTRNA